MVAAAKQAIERGQGAAATVIPTAAVVPLREEVAWVVVMKDGKNFVFRAESAAARHAWVLGVRERVSHLAARDPRWKEALSATSLAATSALAAEESQEPPEEGAAPTPSAQPAAEPPQKSRATSFGRRRGKLPTSAA